MAAGGSAYLWKRTQDEAQARADQQTIAHGLIYNYIPSVRLETNTAAKEKLDALRLGIIAEETINYVAGTVAEIASLGQFKGLFQFEPFIASKLGWSAICEKAAMLPVEKSLFIPTEQYYNSVYTPLIPDSGSLIRMLAKHVITFDEYLIWNRMNGFSDGLSQKAWDAAKATPDLPQLQIALHRGVISELAYTELKTYVGLDERWNHVWDATLWNIPPYQDIINMRVKEVIEQDQFRDYLRLQGYRPEWADKLWTAHFIPPSLQDVLIAWRRGVIDEPEVDRLMRIVDLDVDRFKNVFDTRKFNDPSISLARFMFEIGAIDSARVRDIVKRNGFGGSDQDALVDYIVKFQERRWRTRYLVGLSSAMLYGAATEEEIRAEVAAAGYQPGVAEWLIKYSQLRVKVRNSQLSGGKPRLLSVGDLKKLYKTVKISPRDFDLELRKRGYDDQDITWTMDLLDTEMVKADAGGALSGLTMIQLVDAWRYNAIDEGKFRNILVVRGLSDEEVTIIENTYKAKWGVSPQP